VIVRLVRASNSLALPAMFDRAHYAKSDLLHLIQLHKEKAIDLPKQVRAYIFLMLGEIYKGEGDLKAAQWHLQLTTRIAPNSKESTKARRLLNTIN